MIPAKSPVGLLQVVSSSRGDNAVVVVVVVVGVVTLAGGFPLNCTRIHSHMTRLHSH